MAFFSLQGMEMHLELKMELVIKGTQYLFVKEVSFTQSILCSSVNSF